ncbi:hypothetical protein KC348_g6 [Hortaea werneckii]|nr:hypothetical protein KC348_g6 [Hortaea werneckii]
MKLSNLVSIILDTQLRNDIKVPEDVSLGFEIIYMSRKPHMAILATEGRQMPMLDIRLDCIKLVAFGSAGLCSCLLTTIMMYIAFCRLHNPLAARCAICSSLDVFSLARACYVLVTSTSSGITKVHEVVVFCGPRKAIDVLEDVDHILIPIEENVKRWISGHTPVLHIIAARHQWACRDPGSSLPNTLSDLTAALSILDKCSFTVRCCGRAKAVLEHMLDAKGECCLHQKIDAVTYQLKPKCRSGY